MSLTSVLRDEQTYLVPTYERNPVLFEKGRGVYLWDARGNRYLDFLSGIGVNALGHAHPAIQAALKKQAGRMLHVSNLFFHEHQAQLAKRLTKLSGLDRAFFCNSGTEAWEGALKFARAHARAQNSNGHRPKTQILAMENSFHGRTFGALATTSSAKYRDPFAPLLPGVTFVRFNDVEDLRSKFDDSVCAVGIETIQGESGIRPVSPQFLRAARQLATSHRALLVLDEIQCGLGRTGRYFAYQHHGVQPDMVTVAKPLAAGLPLGAVLTTNQVAASMHPGLHGTTFGGGPLACAVAIEFLRQLDGLLEHIRTVGAYFRDQLEALRQRYDCVREIRGMGLMLGMEMTSAEVAKAVAARILQQKVIINRTHETVLRFLPPYIVQKKHVDVTIHALAGALQAVSRQCPSNNRKITTIR